MTSAEDNGGMKVLFFKTGAIGDVIMTTPLLRQFKKNFPDAKVDYLVGDYCKPILEDNPNVNEIITFDPNIYFKKQMPAWLELIKKIRKTKYDMIFVLDKHISLNLTAKLFGIKKRIGFDRNGEGLSLTSKVKFDGRQHEIHSFLDLLKSIKLKTDYEDVQTELYLSKEDLEFAEELWKDKGLEGKKVICVAPGGANNPGAQAYQKVWPKERYLELIKKLIEKKYFIILVGDKNDVSITDFIVNSLFSNQKTNIFSLVGKTTIKQTASIMKKCNYIVCNDTGSLHIASSVNNKTIALFGPTRAKRFAPLHKESQHIQSDLSCFDCYDVYGNFGKCGHNNVIKDIRVDEVLGCIK